MDGAGTNGSPKRPSDSQVVASILSSTGSVGGSAGIIAYHGGAGWAVVVAVTGLLPACLVIIAAHATTLADLARSLGECYLRFGYSRSYSYAAKKAAKNPQDRDRRTLLYDLDSTHPAADDRRLPPRRSSANRGTVVPRSN